MNATGAWAIQTRYKGYSFRSRLEARWAVFFDELGIRWEYEKEGYALDGVCYLPDFWLPEVGMWAEVKDGLFSENDAEKVRKLCILSGHPVLLLIGVPEDKPYIGLTKSVDGTISEVEYCLTMYHNYPKEEGRFYASPGGKDDSHWDDTREAAEAARSARFEFNGG